MEMGMGVMKMGMLEEKMEVEVGAEMGGRWKGWGWGLTPAPSPAAGG